MLSRRRSGEGVNRAGGAPTAEGGWKLDLANCIRKGMIVPGQRVTGTMTWTLTQTGQGTATIGCGASFANAETAWVRLHYTRTSADVSKMDRDYRAQLETTRPNYGGIRLFPEMGGRTPRPISWRYAPDKCNS